MTGFFQYKMIGTVHDDRGRNPTYDTLHEVANISSSTQNCVNSSESARPLLEAQHQCVYFPNIQKS